MIIDRLCVEAQVADHPMVASIAQRMGLKPRLVNEASQLFSQIKNDPDPWGRGKRLLLLSRNKGPFLKQCPGTREYICCGYQILHFGSYCTMDCSYCILQSYFHPPVMHYFVNHEDLMSELDQKLDQSNIQRIGTGEFTDSLIWESGSDLTSRLVERFGSQEKAVLEIKTKTTAIDHLESLASNGKTIMSWSLNTPRIIAGQERGTATLRARLRAAARCFSWGYPLAFHFDPLMIYPGCENEYQCVIQELFDTIPADAIVWISMGTLRFMPALKPIIQRRFPDSNIIYGEFIPGLDGKMRYFKPLRIDLYRRMVQWIRDLAPRVTVYLCMEDDQVWMQSLGFSPQSKGGLPAMLDESARLHCGLS